MRYGQAVLDPVRAVKRQRILREIKTFAKPNLSGDRPFVSGRANLRGPRLLDQLGDPPCLGPGDRAALLDHDQIALAALVLLIVGVVFLRAGHDLSIHRMGDAALDQYCDGLVHLVADDSSGQRPGSLALAHFASAFSFRMVRTRAMSRRTLFSWLLLVSCCVAFCMRRPNWARRSSSSSLESCAGSLARSSLAFMIMPSCTTLTPSDGTQTPCAAEAWLRRGQTPPAPSARPPRPFRRAPCPA